MLGVLSLIFWALMLVITGKYPTFVMRASNQGEGGILALVSQNPLPARKRVTLLGNVFGVALPYGDGVVTPATSGLSAVEGAKAVSPIFVEWAVPFTCVILMLLFSGQRRGTNRIVFGPIMVI